jgi:iron complex outermembrane receptor protein
VLTGELNDVGTPVRANVDKSYRTGIELSGSYEITPQLRLTGNVTFSVNKIKAFTETVYTYDPSYTRVDSLTISNNYENTDISFSPSWIGYLELTYFPIDGAEIAYINKFVGSQFLDNTSSADRQLDRYYQSDLRLSYSLYTSIAKEIRLTLLLNNITNRLFESNGYTFRENYLDAGGNQSGIIDYNYYYPQAGFNFLLGLDIRF